MQVYRLGSNCFIERQYAVKIYDGPYFRETVCFDKVVSLKKVYVKNK